MLKNKIKYIIPLILFMGICFQPMAFGWIATSTIGDYSNDLKRFDYKFTEQFTVDYKDNFYFDLYNMSEGFGDAWYTSQASDLTDNEMEKYGYVDVQQIMQEPSSTEDTTRITVRLGASLKDETWMMLLWSFTESSDNPMCLIFMAYNDTYLVLDMQNEDTYDADWSESTNELNCDVDEKVWNEDDVKAMSVGYSGSGDDADLIVDMIPNPVDTVALYIWITVIIAICVLIGVMYYLYKRGN